MKFYTRTLLSCVCLTILMLAVPGLSRLDSAANLVDDYQVAQAVFVHAKAEIKEIKLQAWGQISNRLEPVEGLKEKFDAVARGLGLDPAGAAVQLEKDGFAAISQLEIKDGDTWQLSMQAVPISGAPNGGESFAGILYSTNSPRRGREVYAALCSVLREIGLQDNCGVTFSGVIAGDPGPEGRLALSDRMAALYAGEYVEGIAQENFSSICYYIRQNSKSLPVNGRRINLNIALRYDGQEDRTYLYAGAPLIYQDY